MAILSWSSGNSHLTDVEFRRWGKEVSDKFQAVGIWTKAADTGQINWATVARPAINTTAGFEIYYLNDSLHASAPIYVKIGYGTGTTAPRPRMTFIIGTATDGAGVLSGIGVLAETLFTQQSADGSTVVYPSYLCCINGYFGFTWKIGGNYSWLFIQRTCDADGTPNAKGALVLFRNGTSYSSMCLRYEATAVAYAQSAAGMTALVPETRTSSLLQNGNVQLYPHWGSFPDMRPLWATAAYVIAEVAISTTFTSRMVGAATRTWLATNIAASANGNNGTYAIAMLWE